MSDNLSKVVSTEAVDLALDAYHGPDKSYGIGELDRERSHMRAAVIAAIGAGGQAATWPYGGCELSEDVPCNPFDCCEICQIPGAGRHFQADYERRTTHQEK